MPRAKRAEIFKDCSGNAPKMLGSIPRQPHKGKNPPSPFRVSVVCEDFVQVFATTAGPKPDPSHAIAIRGPPSTVVLGFTLLANPKKPIKTSENLNS